MKWLKSLVCLSLCTVSWQAAAAWPEQAIKIIVPFSAGAMGDNLARLLADPLQKELQTPVIVDNRPGAGGNIGANVVANAAPDGYTLMMAATNNLVLNQFLYNNLGYDPLKKFAPVIMVADVPAVAFVTGDLPVNNFEEFRELTRSKPGMYNYGSPGAGTTPHLSAQAINDFYDLQMVHVPYGGASQAVQALLAGDIHFYLGGAGLAAAHIQSGKVKAIGVAATERLSALPDVPTFKEAGLDAVLANNWWALAAPAGTPTEVIETINKAVQKALESPEIQNRFNALGVIPVGGSSRDMANTLKQDAAFWEKAVQNAGIKLD